VRRVTSLTDENDESARRALVLAGVAVAVTLAVDLFVLIEAARKGTATGIFTRDVRTVIVEAHTKPPFYAGWVCQLNIMIWAAAAALAAAVAYVQTVRRGWMLGFVVLLTLLGLDDALMLHEWGVHGLVPEKALCAVYAVLGLALLSRLHWRDPVTGLFVAGGICLAVSITIDQLSPHIFLTEDSFKFLGALLWLAIPVLCLTRIRDQVATTFTPVD
jgi:hypothetical protein